MQKWITLVAQVQKHLDRGLVLGEITRAGFAQFLYSNNYYRVSGYGCCLYEGGVGRYRRGVTAGYLMDIYERDREVRNLVLDGIGVVEPTVRSRIAYHLGQVLDGDDGYLRSDFYLPTAPKPSVAETAALTRWRAEIANRDTVLKGFRALHKRKEIVAQHDVARGDPVPLWSIIEVVSMGMFSRFLRALRDKSVLTPVAKSLGFDGLPRFLQAIQNLAFLRNVAAHHGRLWNRRLEGYVALPGIALALKRRYLAPRTPAAAITLLAGLVDRINEDTTYSTALLDLVHASEDYAEGCYRPASKCA